MSGLNEQDIPICMACELIPRYWILYPNSSAAVYDGWLWLFSNEYLKENGSITRLDGYSNINLTGVESVVCNKCGTIYKNRSKMFKIVLNFACGV